MSKHSIKKKPEETAAASVGELDDALEALPGGESSGGSVEVNSDNPLEQVDVSGTTSFESAEFAAHDDERESDREEFEEEEHPIVIYDADAEDRAEAGVSGEVADDEIAPGGQPRELAEL